MYIWEDFICYFIIFYYIKIDRFLKMDRFQGSSGSIENGGMFTREQIMKLSQYACYHIVQAVNANLWV